MGFRELEHTADWALEVWAEELPGLFQDAAAGMVALQGLCFAESAPEKRQYNFEGVDYESLLVSFLGELLYIQESDRLGCRAVNILELTPQRMLVEVSLVKIQNLEKAVKAVTYHDLIIVFAAGQWSARIVMDV